MTISGTLPNALAITCQPWTTVFRKGSVFVHPLCSDKDLTLSGCLAASHMPVAAPKDKPATCAVGFVAFPRSAEVDGEAGEVLGVLRHLEGVTSVIGGQVGNEDQRFSGSLLVIVHGDVIGFDFRHGSLSL